MQLLQRPLRKLNIGTYVDPTAEGATPEDPFFPIATARMDTEVSSAVHLFSEKSISAVPIVDKDGIVVNLYELVDVIVRNVPSLMRLISRACRP